MDALHNLASRAYSTLRSSDAAGPEAGTFVSSRAAEFLQTLSEAETATAAATSGQGDSHDLVNALAQSELAVETVVAVRNKVVEAYQEILRMSV